MFTQLETEHQKCQTVACGDLTLTGFKFIDRGEKKSIVLIPGWAFDCRIFNNLNLRYNYFLYCGNSGSDFEVELKKTLRAFGGGTSTGSGHSTNKISLFGWSQGAFTAYDFACKNPLITNELILVSIQLMYKKEVLENIKSLLKRNKNAYLIKFYKDCFSGSEIKYFKWFKENLLNDYLQKFKTDDLIQGLDRLSDFKINPDPARRGRINPQLLKNLTIVQGEKDKIADFNNIKVKENFKEAKFIIFKDSGHLPFLNAAFKL